MHTYDTSFQINRRRFQGCYAGRSYLHLWHVLEIQISMVCYLIKVIEVSQIIITTRKSGWIYKSCHNSMTKNKMPMQAQLNKMKRLLKFSELDRLCPID